MKLLIIASMPNELKSIKQGIKSANLKVNLNIDYLCTGIGNYETIFSLEQYLSKDEGSLFIRNIGICGYWNSTNIELNNPIQAASIINMHTEKEYVCPPFLQLAPLRTCFSSERVIKSFPDSLKNISTINDEYYFDMESWGIEFVASKYKIPHLVLKVPFDFIGMKNSLFEKGNINELKESIAKLLVGLPYYNYLNKILDWMK